MEDRARRLAVKARSALFLVAIVAALAVLYINTYSETYAQTESSAELEAPALTAASTGENAVALSWNSVFSAVRYELWVWWNSDTDWQRLDGGGLTGTSYTHSGLSAGTTYHYAVRAVGADGNTSAWSEYARVTVPETQTATPSPTSTQAATLGSTSTPTPTPTASTLSAPTLTAQAGASSVELSWSPVSGAVRYELWVWRDSASGWQRLDDGSLTGISFMHRGVSPGTTYFYAVQAVSAGGELGEWSQFANASAGQAPIATHTPTASTQTVATATPTASTQTVATATPTSTATLAATPTATPSVAGSVLSKPVLTAEAAASSVVLSWALVSGAIRYELWVWRDEASGWQQLDDGGLTGTSFTHNGITLGTTYHYALRAVDAHGGTSEWSEFANATVSDGSTQTATATPSVTATPTMTPTQGDTPTATVTPTVATTQRGALIALYEATDGDNWKHNDNWLTDAPLDSWYGVTADRLGRVDRLRLRYNGLNGHIPDLSALADLTTLSLSFNSFPGPFPDLSALTTNLSSLSLQDNELTGPIPDLSAFSNLAYLTINHNQLTGPIPDRDRLPNLIELSLHSNRLTGTIPHGLGELLNLQFLYLSGNDLSGCIPESLRLIRGHDLDGLGLPYCPAPTPTPGPTPTPATTERGALIALYEATGGANWPYKYNWLTAKPISQWYGVTTDSFGRATELDVRFNNLTGKIPDLSALSNLRKLRLAGNNLTGSIPNFSALTNLRDLDLGNNELTGTIPDLGGLTNLTRLRLYGNRLTGHIPDLSKLTNLSDLELGLNRLSGPIPDLSKLTDLTLLHLSDNQLTGPIPDLSALTELRKLIIADNQLSGSIPDLKTLTKLTELVLAGNQLTGQVPDLSGLTELQQIRLSDNRLSGEIPDLSSFTKLNDLELEQNQLTGRIPDVSALSKVRLLDLSDNNLNGPIPDLSNLINLVDLNLKNNQLTGPILDLPLLTNLAFVILERNMLTGPIPDLSALPRLSTLRLDGNSLCLPAGASLSHPNINVADDLKSLNPPACTEADLAGLVGMPQNLAATVNGSQVTLTWDAVRSAVSYEVKAWDSIGQQWGSIGGVLTTAAFTHTTQADGRNYLYQVSARGANGARSSWSQGVYAIVVPKQFPPPPISLGLDLIYQKYFEVDGLGVVAVRDVTDEKMVQTREIITGMLANRSDLLEAMAYYDTRIHIRDELYFSAFKFATSAEEVWGANVPETETYCYVMIHEFAHVIHFSLEDQADGEAFNAKLQALFDAALTAGLWNDDYASTNIAEYWAETVTFWFEERVVANQLKLADYDPAAARLIEEVFGEGTTVPSDCKR